MSKPVTRPANLHDVAKRAGVSYQTVSRVINEHPYVSEETRERVLKAIEEMNYHPNRAARSLITGRSQTIQIVSSDLTFFQPIPSMVNTAHKHGYQIGLSPIAPNASTNEMKLFVHDLKSRMTDGLLIISPYNTFLLEEFERMCAEAIPFVQVGGTPGPRSPAVWIDQRFGMRQAVLHLLEAGHRQFAEVSGLVSGPTVNHDALMRHETIKAVLGEHGLELVGSEQAPFMPGQGYDAVLTLLKKQARFTALLCGNDDLAMGALTALQDQGLRVPEDVSVIGFDNAPFAPFSRPPLTTVAQDYVTLGDLSVDHLISMIENPEQPRYQRVIYPQLIVRMSTNKVA